MPFIGMSAYVYTLHIECGNDVGHDSSVTGVFVGQDEIVLEETATIWAAEHIMELARKHLVQDELEAYEEMFFHENYDKIFELAEEENLAWIHYGPNHVDSIDTEV